MNLKWHHQALSKFKEGMIGENDNITFIELFTSLGYLLIVNRYHSVLNQHFGLNTILGNINQFNDLAKSYWIRRNSYNLFFHLSIKYY